MPIRWPFSVLVVAIALVPWSSIRADESIAATYDNLKPSLALVATFRGDKLVTLGTGFCVSSSSTGSIFVTNRHVIEAGDEYEIVRQFPASATLSAKVIRSGTGPRDVAFLEVAEPNIPHVAIDPAPPKAGDRVAIAGYPHTQLLLGAVGLGLTPSVHAGTVNALPAGGFYIQFDAQTEPGNSGGPLFDPSTGAVEGIVVLKVGQRESNFAIAADQLLPVAANAHVSFTLIDRAAPASAPPQPIASPTPPISVVGTYKGLVQDTVAGSGAITLTLSQVGANVTGTFSSIFIYPHSSYKNSGNINGSVEGDSLNVTAIPSVPGTCPFSATAVISKGGEEISGTYATFGCKTSASGSIQIDKED